MSLNIRRATERDAASIADFNSRMAWETEHKRLDPDVVGRGVSRVFGDSAKGFYLVAESAGEVVGQLMITFEWSDWRDGWFWWIQSVYVREDQRRSGVFRSLYEATIQLAKSEQNVVGLRLYVERDNTRAQRTYEQLGMRNADYLVQEIMLT
ncbi:MAG: GNAT family N-acetyltransferase [Gemmataceae bacterium]|nr:GNAT family N-acetyltransferase [Gemmataceae bacterium]